MLFTDKLYLETKNAHTIVDKHPFVFMIRNNYHAGELYINLNKICIYHIQTTLKLQNPHLYSNLYRKIERLPEIYITNTLLELIQHCKTFPLESAYQFYLGLLFGGNMLKKMLPTKHHDFLTYDNPKELISHFKTYLCNHISNTQQETFIQNVNKAYTLIAIIFDEFFDKIKLLMESPS